MKLPSSLQRLSTLQLALGVSIAVHAVLLTVKFVDPERFERVFQDTPLEVILVNARANETPDTAQAIAQTALAGGGDADKGRATSPMPYSALTAVGDDFEEKQRQIDAMQQQQTQLLTQLRQQVAALPPLDPRLSSDAQAKEAVYAVYYDALRRKVEDKGTENFPENKGKKLYGELVMILTVNHDGRVLSTEIVQGSGNRMLDTRAEAIARSAGPYGHFGPAMRAKADQIAVVSRFRFTREQTLETDVR